MWTLGEVEELETKRRIRRLSPELTLPQLVVHDHQEGHGNHEEVEDEADLTQLADGPSTHLLHYRLVGALTADGRGVAQDDQTTDQEHKGGLR